MKKIYQKMGHIESKQKLEQITNSLERIRKDVRNGKITANDVERFHQILKNYSSEIDVNLSKKVRASDVYTVEQLIEITSQELDALKQEVNLDLASIPTNSFSRASSKRQTKEREKNVKSIIASTEQIRELIRNNQVDPQEHERLQGTLAGFSQRLSYISKKGKKKEVDAAQKLVSSATEELFKAQDKNDNVRASTTPPSRRSSMHQEYSSRRSSVKSRETPKLVNRNITGTLEDIETKLEALKSDVQTAKSNKDRSRLHFLAKSIQTLMTDLQLINVKNQMINEEKKALLEKNLIRLHQQIDKFKRQLSTESDINYLTELHQKEKKEKCLQDLDNIEKSVIAMSDGLNSQNFQVEKESFMKYKNHLNSIEEMSEEVTLKKAEVLDVVLNVENVFTKLEMEDRLNKAEYKHFQNKIDINKFEETSDSEVFKQHRKYLEQLRDYVSKIYEVSEKINDKKNYILYNIDNNIAALDKRVKENEDKLKEEEKDLVVLRKPRSQASIEDFGGKLKSACREIPASKEMKDVLIEARTIIEQKLKLIQNQNDEPDVQLVKVKENYLEPIKNSVSPIRAQMENIQKEVEALQLHIEKSRYTKETQLYKDLKSKLENYKSQVKNLSNQSDDGGRFSENLLKYVDNVLLLLENSIASRRSTTEDILVDIMSVSTRVTDLGNKIQNMSSTTQDFESIKNSLMEHQQYLKNLQISPQRTNLCKTRDEILLQIERYLTNLDDLRKNSHSFTVSEEEKRFNQDLRKVKEKVTRYSGTYKNVLYNAIERDLDRHLNNVDKVFKDPNMALRVKRDIENSKMILEQKSNKDPNYTSIKKNVREPGGKELTEIRQNVESVKRELGQVKPLTKEELDKLDARLTLSILALDNIKDEHSGQERDKLYNDINFYFARIQELKMMTKPHSVLVEDLQEKQFEQQQVAARIIASVESELEEIKPDIVNFVGTETCPKFFQLDDILVNGTMRLDELNLDQTSELHHLKIKLLREIQKYNDILDERVRQTEDVEKFEKEVKVMLIKIDSFNGYLGDAEYAYLDEEIIRLKIGLGKLRINQELIARKEECMKEIDDCMKKLDEVAKTSSPTSLTGTLV